MYVAHTIFAQEALSAVLEPSYEVTGHTFLLQRALKSNLILCRDSRRELFHGACAASPPWSRDNLRNDTDLTLPDD